ncbi:hypothetical protein [Rhizobium leguminosarum]|uniref:hypothetical protein n=1 Tax=Rhizobium leguminosarum TaxID=384 RepID=UPI0015576751|nr:hypothetical protein [Rhizobium leguminosarum]
MTGFGGGISMAGLAADTSRAFGGSGLPAADGAYRIIARLHFVRYTFTFWSEGVNASGRSSGGYDPVAAVLHGIWAFALKGDEELTQEDDFSRSFESFGLRSAASILPQIQRDYFGLFQIND